MTPAQEAAFSALSVLAALARLIDDHGADPEVLDDLVQEAIGWTRRAGYGEAVADRIDEMYAKGERSRLAATIESVICLTLAPIGAAAITSETPDSRAAALLRAEG